MKLFRSSAERKREKTLADRQWQFDALASHIQSEITRSPAAKIEVLPIENAHSTYYYTSEAYTIPDGYVNESGNTVTLGGSFERWGNLPLRDANNDGEPDTLPFTKLSIRFGSAARLLATSSELAHIPEDVTIELAKEDLLDTATPERLRLIEVAIRAAKASRSDIRMPSAQELRLLTDARIAHNYREFATSQQAAPMLDELTKAARRAETPTPPAPAHAAKTPHTEGWELYSTETTPERIKHGQPAVSDVAANAVIVADAARNTPAKNYQSREVTTPSNGYSIEAFAKDCSGGSLPRADRNTIAALARAQANHSRLNSMQFSESIRQPNAMYVVGIGIEKLPIGYSASLNELLLTEQAYLETTEHHPEWFETDGKGIDNAPILYWMTGEGDNLRIHCNSKTVAYSLEADRLGRLSTHIGLRNITNLDIMPKIVARSFKRRQP